jgi:hypothetical protein
MMNVIKYWTCKVALHIGFDCFLDVMEEIWHSILFFMLAACPAANLITAGTVMIIAGSPAYSRSGITLL